MKGAELLTSLRKALGVANNSALARRIGVTPARVTHIKGTEDMSSNYVAGLISKLAASRSAEIIKSSIHPIVEFFPIEQTTSEREGCYIPFDFTTENGRRLREALSSQDRSPVSGIYSFYNSQGEIIYLGKTEKQNIFKEMTSAYNRKMASCKVYRVRHPWGKYKPNGSGDVRQIQKENVYIYHIAAYFSAYQVQKDLTSAVESLLIRIMPNDIINARIEKKALAVLPPAKM